MPLKTQHRTYLYLLLSVFSLSVIAGCIYYALGGFKEVILFETKNNIYSIAGKEFRGSISSDTIGLYFNEMKTIIEKGDLNGDLCLINYQDENLANKEVRHFIGILLGDEITEIPSGLKVREIEEENSFKAALIMHPLVRPNSEKVQGMLHEYAQELGYELKSYTLEMFYPDNSVIVEMFGTEAKGE